MSTKRRPFLRPLRDTAARAAQRAVEAKELREIQATKRRLLSGYNTATRGLQLSPGEFKSIDENVAGINIDTTGALTLLNGCARGSDIDEREGREIMMKSIQMRGLINCNANAVNDQWARILIVYDRQTNGTVPTPADILNPASIPGMRNLENRKRFKILMDKTYTLNTNYTGAATVYDATNNHHFIEYYRKLEHPVTFNSGSAGTVADISTGSLYMLTLGSVVAGTAACAISMCSRVRFQDK